MENTKEMQEISIAAKVENLDKVLAFVDELLVTQDCSMKVQMQIDIAVEELFVNIAKYAYESGEGNALIQVVFTHDPLIVSITFIDHGIPYDPVKKEDPDITLPAEKRSIGGLGIYMVKKSMDNMYYEYKDGKNVLTIQKRL